MNSQMLLSIYDSVFRVIKKNGKENSQLLEDASKNPLNRVPRDLGHFLSLGFSQSSSICFLSALRFFCRNL